MLLFSLKHAIIFSPDTRPILQVVEPLFPDESEALHISVSRQLLGVERSRTLVLFSYVITTIGGLWILQRKVQVKVTTLELPVTRQLNPIQVAAGYGSEVGLVSMLRVRPVCTYIRIIYTFT